jgi:microcystin-dependent protein
MSQPFVGEIRMFAGNFPPAGWMFCEGQLLPISENEVLFQLIGTTYGGDGQSTFALPDLRGRIPVHLGTGGGQTVGLGQSGGNTAWGNAVAVAQGLSLGRGLNAQSTTTPVLRANVEIQSPALAVNFIISLFGIFPSQA